MTTPIGGGKNQFQPAQGGLERRSYAMGSPVLQGANIQGAGNVQVAPGMLNRDVPYAAIGKGQEGVRGGNPIRLMGADPFRSQPLTPGMGTQFAPAPAPVAPPQQQVPQAPSSPSLGDNEEVHVLVAKLQGPSGRNYEAVYEVVVPERGSRVLGVSERPVQ